MSIESLLTLGVAVGILAIAAILRLVVMGAWKLYRLVVGRPAREPRLAEAVARLSLGERAGRIAGRAAGAVGSVLVVVVATVATWARWVIERLRPSSTRPHVTVRDL